MSKGKLWTPRVSDQLDLWDGTGVHGLDVKTLPWEGRSPRGLTQAGLSPIFKPRGAKSTSDFFSDENQLEFWDDQKRGSAIYRGAPSLLPLPRRIR